MVIVTFKSYQNLFCKLERTTFGKKYIEGRLKYESYCDQAAVSMKVC